MILNGAHVMARTKVGVCHICGERGSLSFEHIPPKSAGNTGVSKAYNVADIIAARHSFDLSDKTGVKYRQWQQGSGFQTICSACNNYFGANYVDEFSKCIVELKGLILSHALAKDAKGIHLESQNINVLGFFKHIIGNFCAVNQPGSMMDCKEFLLNRESNDFPSRLRLYMFVIPSRNERMITTGWTELITDILAQEGFWVSALAYFPVGFYLYDESISTARPTLNLGCEITQMSEIPWGDKPHFVIDLPYMTIDDGFPHLI